MLAFTEIKPPVALQAYVDFFWIFHNAPHDGVHLVLPDGAMDLVVKAPSGALRLSGAASSFRMELPSAAGQIVGVRLKPGSLAALTRVPAAEFRNREIPWNDFSRRAIADFTLATPKGLLVALETFLLDAFRGAEPIDPVVAVAVRAIEETRGMTHIAELERQGIDSRQLRRKFDRSVGLSPKQFARIIRLSHFVDKLRLQREPDWADWAAEAGYYDQSHLIHEFSELSGTTPERYLATAPAVRFFQYGSLRALY